MTTPENTTIPGEIIEPTENNESVETPPEDVEICSYPAPVAANGGGYVGCMIPKDHEGDHMVMFRW